MVIAPYHPELCPVVTVRYHPSHLYIIYCTVTVEHNSYTESDLRNVSIINWAEAR